MKIFHYGFSCIIICLILTSCSITPELTKQENEVFNSPHTPYRKTTNFTQALSNLGVMIDTYGFPGTIVQGKNVINKTSCQDSLPLDITDMIKTAVNSIGEKVRYVVYDPGFDHYKHGDYFKRYGAGMFKRKPSVVIEGAITECDEDINVKSSGGSAYGTVGGGKAETDLDFGMNKNSSYSRLALDLHMMEYKTDWLLPQKQTSMAVDVYTLEKGRSFGFAIYGFGLGIDGRRKKVQGKHNAVRALVDLSILKLIGRFLEIPYWRCIPGENEDPAVINMMRADFRKQNSAARIGLIQYLLTKYGYNIPVSNTLDRPTQQAVRDFRSRYGRGSEQVDENLYVDLMLSVPMPFLSEKKINWTSSQTSPSYKAPAHIQPSSQPPSSFSFQANFVYRDQGTGTLRQIQKGSTLKSGDYYKIVIRPDEDCYLYIFQADSSGQLFQLFPMKSFKGVVVNNANPVRQGQIYTLPAKNKAFVLDNSTGRERIWLVASGQRNMEIESLYAEMTEGRSQHQIYQANRRLLTYLDKKRGVQGIASDQPVSVAWKETGHIFSLLSQRLERICKNCAYVLDFNHQ